MTRKNGFTITELLVVMAIVAILLGIGVPSYRYITNSYRMSAEVNSLLGDMQFARAEAIKEGQFVVVCASSTSATCTNTAWNQGWIVFADTNNDLQLDNGETLLHVQQAFSGQIPDTLAANVTAVRYNREGFATATAALPTTFTLTESTNNDAWKRCLLLTAVGTASTLTHAVDPVNCQ